MDINFRLSYLSNNGFVDLFPKTNTLGIIDAEQSLSFASASVQIPAYSGQTQTIPLSIFDSVKGNNFIYNSSFNLGIDGWSLYFSSGSYAFVDGREGNKAVTLSRSGYSGTVRYGFQQTGIATRLPSIMAGETYTLSAWVRVNETLDSDNNEIFLRSRAGDAPEIKIPPTATVGEWIKYESTNTFNSDCVPSNIFILLGGNGSISVSEIKLEKSSKATDWTPAPEDSWVEMVLVGDTEQEQKDYSTITQFQVFNNQLVITRLNQMPTNSIEVKLLFYIRGGIEYE